MPRTNGDSAPAPDPSAKPATAHAPLTGLRVLDMTRLYPGPLAGQLLAGMGAEVVKLEHPAYPDPMRTYPPFIGTASAGYVATNAGKRSLVLDWRTERGLRVFWDLARRADVLLEGFRPGQMTAWSLSYPRVAEVNPGIVYVSLTGYGQDGPDADKAGHDLNYLARSGILGLFTIGEGPPNPPAVQMADVAGGAYMAVIASLAALQARANHPERRGSWVDTAMLDGVLPLLSLQWAHHQATPAATGPLSGALACYAVYACADGGHVALGALEPKFWRRFCQLAGHPGWIARQFALGAAAAELKGEVAAWFRDQPREKLLALAAERDVCLTPVAGLDDMKHDPQLRARHMFASQQLPGGGTFTALGQPLKFCAPAPPLDPAPALGADSRAILKDLGYGQAMIDDLIEAGIVSAEP